MLIVDLRDRYADLRRTLNRHLKRLYDAGHVVCVSYSAALGDDPRCYWRYQQQLYPGVTDRKLMRDYVRSNATAMAQINQFYADRAAAPA
jgi:transcription initiation factor IIE alpha subunit